MENAHPPTPLDYKRPVSVLVIVHTSDLQILLLERAAHPGFWQSVTGSIEHGESLLETAVREVAEETGLAIQSTALQIWKLRNRFDILPQWQARYGPGITTNLEHVFSVCVPSATPVHIAAREHRAWQWLPWREAAQCCFSWTNRDAIFMLHDHLSSRPFRR